jgi:DNA-binding MarR family transcriptional regulator
MYSNSLTAAARAFESFTLDVFRLSTRLGAAGDRLVSELGLTSVRWQVLGSVVESKAPQPVAWIARDLGAHRQNVQRVVNDLEKDGLVEYRLNPHHRRAHLVVVTERGRAVFEQALEISTPWVNHIADGLTAEDVATAIRVLRAVKEGVDTFAYPNRPAADGSRKLPGE